MKDRTTGLVLLSLSALLFATQHLAEAVIKSNGLSTSSVRYKELIGDNRLVLAMAILLAVAGTFCLVLAARRDPSGD